MDWENERYVRVYTRDTIDWVALGWEAQALFLMLMRKVDRSGVLEVGKHGARGVAGLIGMPVEVVERALAVLTADGCVTIRDGLLLVPNFIEAQEAKQSDKQRQKESRDKRRKGAMSRDVTGPSRIVTEGHSQSHAVTDGHTLSHQPSLASQSNQPSQPESSRARDPGTTDTDAEPERKKTAYDWRAFFSACWWKKRGRQYGQGEADAKACGRLDEFLASLPDDERAKDWEQRERMVSEFLGRADRATVESGWSFSFFASGFQGLRIPVSERPQPQNVNGRPQPRQANYGK